MSGKVGQVITRSSRRIVVELPLPAIARLFPGFAFVEDATHAGHHIADAPAFVKRLSELYAADVFWTAADCYNDDGPKHTLTDIPATATVFGVTRKTGRGYVGVGLLHKTFPLSGPEDVCPAYRLTERR